MVIWDIAFESPNPPILRRHQIPELLNPASGLPLLPATPSIRLPSPAWEPGVPRQYSRPDYAHWFQCIGSACEDTCCKGWGVPIDQATYEKYSRTDGLKEHLGTLVVLNTNQATVADHARISLTANAECSFLDEKRMCGIQKQFGPEMLSVTCATYPRAISTHAREVETALNLSCPEAARTALLGPSLLGDGAWQNQGPQRYASVREPGLDPEIFRQPNLGKKVRIRPESHAGGFEPQLAIREFVLLLLSDRRYPIWQRLYLLGILTRRLQALTEATKSASAAEWAEENPGKVAQLLTDSARIAGHESMRPAMDKVSGQSEQQLQLVVELLRLRVQQPPVPKRFIECVQDFERGLGCGRDPEEQIPENYVESYKRYYRPLTERHPQMLENYLINFVFKNNYPFGRQANGAKASAESEQLALCVHAAVTQTLLIGMAAHYREEFDCTHVVKLVQSMARTFEHSRESVSQIAEFVRAQKLNTLKGMTVLLRIDG